MRSFIKNLDLYLLQQGKGDKDFTFYINSGLDLNLMNTKHTTTLFILAQVHSKLNNIDEGIKYCGLTMKRQLAQGKSTLDLKDWVVNALTLGDAFLARDHFCQAEYLLYAAFNILDG